MAKKIQRRNPQIPPYALAGGQPLQHFKGFASPAENMVAIQNQLRSPPRGYVLDLSTARTVAAGSAFVLGVAGNSFYVDAAADVGNASVNFQDTSLEGDQPPIFVGAQFIARVPFTRIIFENTAQPGKVLRFFYGVDIDFVPGINNQTVITGNVAIVDSSGDTIDSTGMLQAITTAERYVLTEDGGFKAGVDYVTNAVLGLNVPGPIVAAASNVNGMILWKAEQMIAAGTNADSSILSKATAPASTIDGIVHGFWGVQIGAPSWIRQPPLERAIRIAAGLRLDRITGVLETSARATAAYTLA